MSWLDRVPKYESCDECPWPGVCMKDGTCWEQVTRDEQAALDERAKPAAEKRKK